VIWAKTRRTAASLQAKTAAPGLGRQLVSTVWVKMQEEVADGVIAGKSIHLQHGVANLDRPPATRSGRNAARRPFPTS